jgi:hypothetical protein
VKYFKELIEKPVQSKEIMIDKHPDQQNKTKQMNHLAGKI